MASHITLDEEEVIVAELASGKSFRAVARQTGRDDRTIRAFALKNAERIDECRDDLALMFSDVARRAITHITDEKLALSSARDLGVLSGIMCDKNLLLNGKPTQNIAVILASVMANDPLLGDIPE